MGLTASEASEQPPLSHASEASGGVNLASSSQKNRESRLRPQPVLHIAILANELAVDIDLNAKG